MVILVFINLIYAATPTLMKVAVEEMSPVTLVWLRHSIALLAIAPFAIYRKLPRASLRDLGIIAIATLLAFTTTSLMQVEAMRLSSATSGALMVAMQPIVTIMMAVAFLGERFRPVFALALLLSLGGLGLLSDGDLHLWQGNLLYIVAIVCESSLGIFLQPLLRRLNPVQITFYCLIFASAFLLPFQSPSELGRYSASAWASVLYLGLGCSALGTWLWLHTLRKMPVSTVAMAWFLQPLWGSILPIIVLGESLTPAIALGGVLILASVILASPRRVRQKAVVGSAQALPVGLFIPERNHPYPRNVMPLIARNRIPLHPH